MTAPKTGAPEWEGSQGSPWLDVNKAIRIFDCFAVRAIVQDRDQTAPPGSCNDGDAYLVKATATGAWLAKDGMLAIAMGTNASNGWVFCVVERENVQLWINDEDLLIEWNGSAWVTAPERIARLVDLLDVDDTGLADGHTLFWDQSNGVFFPAPSGLIAPTEFLEIALSDEVTAITTGDGKASWFFGYDFTITEIYIGLGSAVSSSGAVTVDVNKNGSTILSTKPSIDAGERTSLTGTAAVMSAATSTKGDYFSADIDAAGTGAKGLKLIVVGHKT